MTTQQIIIQEVRDHALRVEHINDCFVWGMTKRFEIFKTIIQRRDCRPRDVYQAWSREISKPVCIVTLDENYVEWICTDEMYRNEGIATEVLRAIESRLGPLRIEGVTEEGEAFVESWSRQSGYTVPHTSRVDIGRPTTSSCVSRSVEQASSMATVEEVGDGF